MKHELSCGCTYDPDDQKAGYEYVIALQGECKKVVALFFYNVSEGKMPAKDSTIYKKWHLIETQHHFDVDAHPEWRSEWS